LNKNLSGSRLSETTFYNNSEAVRESVGFL